VFRQQISRYLRRTHVSFRTVIIDMLRRQWRFRVVISVATLAVIAGAIGSYFRGAKNPRVHVRRSGEVIFKDVSESAFDHGTIRETRLILPDEFEFDIHIYDFDAHYFTPGENQVSDESKFLAALREHQIDFEESRVVIFAGASFEGLPEKNFDLCRCRVWNVARLMSREGIHNLGYWSIPAGEFRLKGAPDDSTEDDAGTEADEEEEAKTLGEAGLSGQRRLLVVTVKPLQPESGDSAQAHLNDVVEALGVKGMLPTNYDRGTANPVALELADENNPCTSRRKSIKGKIRKLLERLLNRDNRKHQLEFRDRNPSGLLALEVGFSAYAQRRNGIRKRRNSQRSTLFAP